VLTTSTSPATVSGTRYYTLGGTTVASRTFGGTVDYWWGTRRGR
jgi:hypothetical protein